MIPLRRLLRRALPLLVLVAVLAACSNDDTPAPPTSGAAEAPTSLPPVTSPATTTTTSTTVPPPTTLAPAEGIAADVADLIETAEQVRALEFVVEPEVVVLTPTRFSSTVAGLISGRFNDDRDRALARLFALLEAPGAEEAAARVELIGLPRVAWYDESTATLLVAEPAGELGPTERSEIVHEVIHALTDQHFDWSAMREELHDGHDRLRALDALIEGDATYFQLVYIQQLPEDERLAVADDFLAETETPLAPTWLLRDAIFPFDDGFEFVADLVESGGVAAVDRAYGDPPTSSEHILHPERYRRGETALEVAVAAGLDSMEGLEVASFGELALRLLLEGSTTPGLVTQIADGWGGDAYRIFVDPDADGVAFALLYVGDSEAHTAEVTQALIDLAEDVVGIDDGERRGGGEVYRRNGRPWIFLDREGVGLLMVVSSSSAAGESLADQLSPPA